MKKIVIIGGGTMSHVRNHLSLCAPAFGETAKRLQKLLSGNPDAFAYSTELHLTRMADSASKLETNEDIGHLLDHVIADPDVRCVIFNPALVDFDGKVGDVLPGKHAERLKTIDGDDAMALYPSKKLIGRIRKTRKDIFVVGFKTTTDASPDEQYAAGLRLLKTNSLNLVLANDVVTRRNVIIAPEETQYFATTDRERALQDLTRMMLARIKNRFTRSTVVPGEAIPWANKAVPSNLRDVVNFCIRRGAYKTVLGKTAGHFAFKLDDKQVVTTIRKSNFNDLDKVGMVLIEPEGPNNVVAYGHKPSVGGQSQRIIFDQHKDVDCIVHFHCPPLTDAPVPSRPQWPFECGSHQCGQNTSDGLQVVDLGDGHELKVVYLDNHGPNIVFSHDTPAEKVKGYIGRTFDLTAKTGGLIPESAR